MIFPKVIEVPKQKVKEISIADREQLSRFEVDPGEEFKTGKAKRLYPKACYEKAFRYVDEKGDIPGVKLIHGSYKPPSVDFNSGHAWVELPGGIVFDGVLQRFYEKEAYYKYYQAVKKKEYTKAEMWREGAKHGGTYGEWGN